MDNNKSQTLKASPFASFKAQVAAGPLPAAIAELKLKLKANKKIIYLALGLVALLLVTIIGLSFGQSLANLFGNKEVAIPTLPEVTPTTRPNVTTSFDGLYSEIKSFSGVLPDPAPPAVDENINLTAPKR